MGLKLKIFFIFLTSVFSHLSTETYEDFDSRVIEVSVFFLLIKHRRS